ncbi:IS6 family transposase [Bacillus sp. FDAARGOS_1420]|uniref:IS6 family transposase n=1 Tax=unclassified Bacillus (in: firmicutes) TaxID=185979 RepID=UPI00214CC6FB|nr:IS6 family transposase [Bacillus sp. FDAARGOS_1420]
METLSTGHYFINSEMVEMMEERGVSLAHTTIMRWVHQYGTELNERIRKHLKPTNDSWRADETYLKVKREKMYLYRAIDSEGNTIDFYLSQKRDAKAAKCFLKKTLASCHVTKPRSITADDDKAYPVADTRTKGRKVYTTRYTTSCEKIFKQYH